MSEFLFVMNPTAGKGSARKALATLERLLPELGHSYEIARTERAGHATELARNSGSKFVVAVGGDGTVNEVANGLAGSQKVLGILPTGSGNDFVKSVHIPTGMQAGLEVLRAQNIRRIDAGKVRCARRENGSMQYAPGRYFINGVGIGFDAAVAQRVSEISYLRGTLLYLVAVLQTLGTYRAPEFRTTIGSETVTGKQLLIAAGNGRCAGGGFYLTPDAVVDDGLLDVCLIQDVKVGKILRLIPAVMRGKRVEDKAVNYMKTNALAIESSDGFTVHADGEVLGRDVVGVQMEVSAGSLLMIGPRT